MARPPKHPVDVKLKIVLSVLAGESSQAEAARRHGISETSIGKWKEQFLRAGHEGLEHGDRAGTPTGREQQLLAEVDDLTRALGEAHVELRALKRGARRACRFAELEQLRVEHSLSVQRFCRIVGLPARTYYDRRARHHTGHAVRGPWPTPARDGIRAVVIEMALAFPMWGHRKIAWLCRHEHRIDMSDATCLRILREAGLVLETSGGGTWRSGDVIDYWAKLVLAGPVTATQTGADAVASVQAAIDEAERLLQMPLLADLTDPETGEITPIFLVSDNGPCFKSSTFARFITSRPELTHVRTRRKSPQTNGVIERYHGAIKIEHLWRALPADGAEMTRMVDEFRELYNTIRPHQTLAGARPIERYLTDPTNGASDPISTPLPKRQTMRIP